MKHLLLASINLAKSVEGQLVLHGGGIPYGVRIPIQPSAAGRQKYGKREKGTAPKGCQPALSKARCLIYPIDI